MPISTLHPGALAGLTAAQVADLALSADQEARRARKAGREADAAAHSAETERLAEIFRRK